MKYSNCGPMHFNPYHADFLNGIIHFTFLAFSIIIFRDIKMKTYSWPANSIEPGQDVQASMTLYWWQRLITFGVGRIRVKRNLNRKVMIVLSYEIFNRQCWLTPLWWVDCHLYIPCCECGMLGGRTSRRWNFKYM